jgi:hypothetical protein
MKNLTSLFSLIYWLSKAMIFLILIQLWWSDAKAMSSEGSLAYELERMKVDQAKGLINILGQGHFNFKRHIPCSKLFLLQGKASFYQCDDQTVSFIQPSSTGPGGWNGYCGEVAVSNVTRMLCGKAIDPLKIPAHDVTPGTRPGTLRSATQQIFDHSAQCPRGRWLTRGALTASSYLTRLKAALYNQPHQIRRDRNSVERVEVTPVPVLIASNIQNYHWVTLVDFIYNRNDKYQCDAVVNTWGDQKLMTCENLVKHGNTPIVGYSFLTFTE